MHYLRLPTDRPTVTVVGPDDVKFWRALGLGQPATGEHALVIGDKDEPLASTVLIGTRPEIHRYIDTLGTAEENGLYRSIVNTAVSIRWALTEEERADLWQKPEPAPEPKPDPVEGLTTLPHSGLKVPHTRLTVTGYKGHESSDGEAFTAKLRFDGKIVGVIENSGTGGATMFYPTGASEFGGRDLDEFTKQSRDDHDYHVVEENVLDALVDEAKGTKYVQGALNKGQVPIRQITTYTDSPIWYVSRSGGIPAPAGHEPLTLAKNSVWRKQQNEALNRRVRATANDRWEAWTGKAWERMTPAAA